jgi:heme exporter protein A
VEGDVLSVYDCSYRYPGADRWAFQNIDFEIAPGEVILLRGRNGAGKSTLLKVICGILRPTEGLVVADSGVCSIYMDQAADQMLAFDLTIREQLTAFCKASSASDDVSKRLQEFSIGLNWRVDEFVGHLSGGQRQVIALMAIVESGSNLLCLDEFLSALDSHSAEIARRLIRQFVMRGNFAVIAVSHSALNLQFDREIILGRIDD